MEKRKKFFNFRPLLFIFLLAMSSVYFACKCFVSTYYLFFFILPIFFLIYIIVKKRFFLFAFSLAFLLFVSLYSVIFISNYKDDSIVDMPVTLYGKVEDVDSFSSKGRTVILSNCFVIDAGNISRTLNGKVVATIFVDDEDYIISQYSRVFFDCSISSVDILNEQGDVDTYTLGKGIRYETTQAVNGSDVFNLGDDSNILEKFRSYNRELLISAMGENRGEIAYAILYGQKDDVDDNLMSSFRITGVAHVFAVSGLHVSLIALMLSFLLGKLHFKEYVNFIITFAFLFAFSALCSFSASTIRASIMTLTFLFGRLISRHYDPIHSLSFAGVLLLSINPFNIFSYGFLLSFGAVFGILLFSCLFAKVKFKYSFTQKIFSLFATTISAQLGILPVMASFSALPTYSIIANIILIPLFSFFYNIFFVVNIIVIILPFLKFIYIVPRAFLEGIIFINYKISCLPYSSIEVGSFSFFSTILYYLTLFCGGRLLVVRPSVKVLTSVVLSICCIISIVEVNLPYVPQRSVVTFYKDSSLAQNMIETDNGKIYLVNPTMFYCASLKKSLLKQNIRQIDGVILLRQDEYNLSYFLDNMAYFSPTIYVGDDYYGEELFKYYDVKFEKISSMIIDNTIKLDFQIYNNQVASCTIFVRDKKLAFFSPSTIGEDFNAFLITNFDFNLDYARIYSVQHSAYGSLICRDILFDVDKTISFSL